ncbi:hypothetical protein [Phocaeicola sp.]
MRLIIWILLTISAILPASAQSYISNNRDVNADRMENLDGNNGILILSKHNDLVISTTNTAHEVNVKPYGLNADGLYEYCVIINAADTRTPKIEISRRGSVYKTEIVQSVKPNYLIAYRIEEVANPIHMDEQTKGNDAILDATAAALEFTTTIKNLKVECSPQLQAKISSHVSSYDKNIIITTVVIPIAILKNAEKTMKNIEKEHHTLDSLLLKSDKTAEADWERLDNLADKKTQAENLYTELTNVEIYGEQTNRLSINISDMGPRIKRCYAVLPLTQKVFVTECSAYMSQGGELFSQRKYEEAHTAYVNALKAKDAIEDMKPIIHESVAQCDTCMEYEALSAGALKKIAQMKKDGTATQEEVAKYASAAIEFLQVVNSYNPNEFYTSRIEKLENLLTGMPLNIKFTIVEWKTLQEGNYMPSVEIWAYSGSTPVSSATFPSDRKFKKEMDKQAHNYRRLSVSDIHGIAEIELDRKNLPRGILFHPSNESKAKIEYISMSDLLRKSKGTYMKRQFRLKMYSK